MTPAEEDALIKEALGCLDPKNALAMSAASAVYPRIRLAIRAAYARGKSEAVALERERCAKIVGSYQVPVGNSPAGEMACEWTMDALREIAAAIRRGE